MPLFPWYSTWDLSKQFPGPGTRFRSSWWSLFLGSAKMHTGGSWFWGKKREPGWSWFFWDTREPGCIQNCSLCYMSKTSIWPDTGKNISQRLEVGMATYRDAIRCVSHLQWNSGTAVITIFCLPTNPPTKRNGDTHTKHDKKKDWNDRFRKGST